VSFERIWHLLCSFGCVTDRNRGTNTAALLFNKPMEAAMRAGDRLKTKKLIRSQKSGVLLPREGTFVRAVENLGRELILVNFGSAGDEYLFPEEILPEPSKA
jgi:hypothetical protein